MEHTPGAKAPRSLWAWEAKAEALAYLEARFEDAPRWVRVGWEGQERNPMVGAMEQRRIWDPRFIPGFVMSYDLGGGGMLQAGCGRAFGPGCGLFGVTPG